MHKECLSNIHEEALRDLREVEALIAHIPAQKEEVKEELFCLIDQLQELCPYTQHSNLIRKLVAQFGDAYFFYNKTGDLCLLTDFVKTAKRAESFLI